MFHTITVMHKNLFNLGWKTLKNSSFHAHEVTCAHTNIHPRMHARTPHTEIHRTKLSERSCHTHANSILAEGPIPCMHARVHT